MRVGERLDPRIPSWPESVHYNWDPIGHAGASHHRLTVFATRPSKQEVSAFQTGHAVEFAWAEAGPTLVWLWRGPGWPWSAGFFGWHLLPPERRVAPSADLLPPGKGVPLDMVLVDASTGRIVAIRRVALPGPMMQGFHAAILQQIESPWDPIAYDAAVAAADATSAEELLLRAGGHARVGGR